jgi:hypothetical protein
MDNKTVSVWTIMTLMDATARNVTWLNNVEYIQHQIMTSQRKHLDIVPVRNLDRGLSSGLLGGTASTADDNSCRW